MFEEDGGLVWAASYRTWGSVRGLWLAEADNDDRGEGLGRSSGRVWGGLALEDAPAAAEAVLLCPIRFQGQWQDAGTGFDYNRFRYYDPNSSRYTSSDQIGLNDGYRPHGYFLDPITWFDPFGLVPGQPGLFPKEPYDRSRHYGSTPNSTQKKFCTCGN